MWGVNFTLKLEIKLYARALRVDGLLKYAPRSFSGLGFILS